MANIVADIQYTKRRNQNHGTKGFLNTLARQKQLVWMSVPLFLYIILFNYVPIWGWTMAFQKYKPAKSFAEQEWVGLHNFTNLFSDKEFLLSFRNTLCMSLIVVVLTFVTAILLALLLNEVRHTFIKRSIQTISYLPHFLSWIIVTGIVAMSLSTENGIINIVLMKLGIVDKPIFFMSEGKYFWSIVGLTNVWKETGWNTIIYLAAIAGIDPTLYEAASIDGAGRLQKIRHITLPGIRATAVILLIMNIGHAMDAVGFEIPYLLGNGLNVDYSQTIDIYVLKYGLNLSNYSMATTAGIIRSVVNILMLFLANSLAKMTGDERLI